MRDIRVLQSGDTTMSLCMTLSGHTSNLPRLVVQGHGFEASLLQSGIGQNSLFLHHYDRGRDVIVLLYLFVVYIQCHTLS